MPPVGRKLKVKRGRPLGSRSKSATETASLSAGGWHAASVTDVERRSDKTIAVCWTDAMFGRYTEQLWVIGVARRKSTCALTGATIRRGDAVYRPRLTASHVPTNSEAMILVASMNRTYPEQSVLSRV
ncbi:DUF3331 domain-containing protein [Paraburkholderia sediminicola]|uniref:DUF3331 domain-containing protein n=1 Tax=Paraburkholderia sediminicola TaxID=458836 RepID=UPI0038BACAEB